MEKEYMGAVYANYREQYLSKYHLHWHGNNDQLQKIIDGVGVLSTSKETDEAVVEEMYNSEN